MTDPSSRYDLTVLASLAKIPLELRQLLSSRQRAKLRGEQVGDCKSTGA